MRARVCLNKLTILHCLFPFGFMNCVFLDQTILNIGNLSINRLKINHQLDL